ncbi:S1 family peptidase [Deinococcus sp. 12RED42]|uniref:S1 family peptidase n=1 Tax=Deinococcus sp. 12RED42 TaxID=2745872 RepID=UPI001E2BFBFA|nr:S1 family peptidase [Deinococcus sp. 12RED42]MCD0166732.1 hypothetical protein [Deinococcus sp. 12RED42]
MKKLPHTATLGLLLMLAACQQVPSTTVLQPQTIPSTQSDNVSDQGWDGALVSIAQSFPAFAGYRIEDDNLILLVAKYRGGRELPEGERGRRVGQIRKALLELLAQENAPQLDPEGRLQTYSSLKVKVKNVTYSFGDLQGWRMQLRRALAEGTLSGLSINEGDNTIMAYVPRAELLSQARHYFAGLGIPSAAIELGIMEVQPQLSLKDTVRPPAGGLEIKINEGSTVGPCTIGVNVTFNGVPGFLTASHCSSTQGVTQNSTYDNSTNSTTLLAVESYDVPFSNPEFCAANVDSDKTQYRCQFADVLFAEYKQPSTPGRLVRVQKVLPTTTTLGSRTLVTDAAGTPQYYRIDGTQARPVEGKLLFKIGATSGYTSGRVIDNNFDRVTSTGTESIVLVNSVQIASGDPNVPVSCGGDSGSAWFAESSAITAYVYGIHSSGDRNTARIVANEYCTTTGFFTPMENIYKVFGGSATQETSLKVRN